MSILNELHLRLLRGQSLITLDEWVALSAQPANQSPAAEMTVWHPLLLMGLTAQDLPQLRGLLAPTRRREVMTPEAQIPENRDVMMDTLTKLDYATRDIQNGKQTEYRKEFASSGLPEPLPWHLPRLHLLLRTIQAWGPERLREVTTACHLIRQELSDGMTRGLAGDISSFSRMLELADPQLNRNLPLPILAAQARRSDIQGIHADETTSWIITRAGQFSYSYSTSNVDSHPLIRPLLRSNAEIRDYFALPKRTTTHPSQKTGRPGGPQEEA